MLSNFLSKNSASLTNLVIDMVPAIFGFIFGLQIAVFSGPELRGQTGFFFSITSLSNVIFSSYATHLVLTKNYLTRNIDSFYKNILYINIFNLIAITLIATVFKLISFNFFLFLIASFLSSNLINFSFIYRKYKVASRSLFMISLPWFFLIIITQVANLIGISVSFKFFLFVYLLALLVANLIYIRFTFFKTKVQSTKFDTRYFLVTLSGFGNVLQMNGLIIVFSKFSTSTELGSFALIVSILNSHFTASYSLLRSRTMRSQPILFFRYVLYWLASIFLIFLFLLLSENIVFKMFVNLVYYFFALLLFYFLIFYQEMIISKNYLSGSPIKFGILKVVNSLLFLLIYINLYNYQTSEFFKIASASLVYISLFFMDFLRKNH